jgi:hypothetical protein
VTDSADAVHAQLQRDGFVVLPGLMSPQALERARRDIGALMAEAEWGTGFDGARTRRFPGEWLADTAANSSANLFIDNAARQTAGPG